MHFRPEVIDVRKRAENDASDGFRSNSSSAAFCLPTNWWASCYGLPSVDILDRFHSVMLDQYTLLSTVSDVDYLDLALFSTDRGTARSQH